MNAWKAAQAWELDYWTKNLPERTLFDRMNQQASSLIFLSNFSLPRQPAGRVLDIGPGPTGRLSSMQGELYAIEPLYPDYIAIGVNFDEYEAVYAQPAEHPVPELFNSISLVVSLNVIDHCYDPSQIFTNIFNYLTPDGTALISFDVDKPGFSEGHIVSMTHQQVRELFASTCLSILKESHGHCYRNPDGSWLDSWGGGTAYHWLLKKADHA